MELNIKLNFKDETELMTCSDIAVFLFLKRTNISDLSSLIQTLITFHADKLFMQEPKFKEEVTKIFVKKKEEYEKQKPSDLNI